LIAARRAGAADRLIVRWYGTPSLTETETADARASAAATLAPVGVHVDWRDCARGCGEALGDHEVMVRLVVAPPTALLGSLGSAMVDLAERRGVLATVYVDRVHAVAGRSHVNPATLLGRAVAHEIGHLLLGTSRHAEAGLMRARWSDRELQRESTADWAWSSEEVSRIHEHLTTLTDERTALTVPLSHVSSDVAQP
jgi:hypothetical protein